MTSATMPWGSWTVIPGSTPPNIDRIRNEGVHFKNAFTAHSLCAPSRAGWDYWCSFYGQGNYDRNRININGKHVNKVGYVTDVLTDYAVEFIERYHDQPFLLYLSHKAVHGPFTPAERHKNLYAGESLPKPASWDDDLDDKPEWQRHMQLPKEQNTRIRRKHPVKVPTQRNIRPFNPSNPYQKKYLECIPAIDEGIGRIFETLEKLGQLDDTIIAFAGDNGYFHSEHGMGDKRQAYNEAMRIPFIMRGPDIQTGGTVEEMALKIDLAPTVLVLVGLDTPDAMQGRYLLPLASGKPVDNWRTSVLYTYWRDLPTGLLLDETFPGGLACSAKAAKILPMTQTLDPGIGTMVYECTVTPQSDGIFASHGSRIIGYLFFVQNGVPDFCFTTANTPFHIVDGDESCIGKPTHLLVELDSYNERMRFFVNGEMVQTETIYCKPGRWQKNHGDIVLGVDPEPWIDPLEFSKMSCFTGTIHNFKIYRERVPDLVAYAVKAAAQ